MREDLLQPSLTGPAATETPYSPKSAFYLAFFGGGLAIILYSALNAYRLRRLSRDAPFYIMALIITVWLMYWLLRVPTGGQHVMWFGHRFTLTEANRYLTRFIGLGLWSFFYFLHKKYYQAAMLFDNKYPNPWVPALLCWLAGSGLWVSFLWVLQWMNLQ